MTAEAPARGDILSVSHDRLELQPLLDELTEPSCGALASFIGTVRSPNLGQEIDAIDYQGYEPMILSEMRRLADELHARHAIARLAIVHRLGRLRPGEASLLIVVSAGHRGPALLACQEALELAKSRLPVWKYETGSAGSAYVPGKADAGPTL